MEKLLLLHVRTRKSKKDELIIVDDKHEGFRGSATVVGLDQS